MADDDPRDAGTHRAGGPISIRSGHRTLFIRRADGSTDAVTVPARSGSSAAQGRSLWDLMRALDNHALQSALGGAVTGAEPDRAQELLDWMARAAVGDKQLLRRVTLLGRMYGASFEQAPGWLKENSPAFEQLIDRGRPSTHKLREFLARSSSREAFAAALLRAIFRVAVVGRNPDSFRQLFASSPAASPQREELCYTLTRGLDKELVSWVRSDRARTTRAGQLVAAAAPLDQSLAANQQVEKRVAAFRDWKRYPYSLIIVPGFTPKNAASKPGVHAHAQRRLAQALKDLRAKLAPFILVTGANVYPRGTRYFEALEMKTALVGMGVAADKIIVEARARHSTTNLRNAGRTMLRHGLGKAVITTTFWQDFYFSNPNLSMFHSRCQDELGYRLGELDDKPTGTPFPDGSHAEFTPSSKVRRLNFRDPLDP